MVVFMCELWKEGLVGCEHITEKGQHPKGVDKRRRHHQERVVAEVMRTRKDDMGPKGVEKSGEDSQRQVSHQDP